LSKWGKREGAKTKVGKFLGVLHKVIILVLPGPNHSHSPKPLSSKLMSGGPFKSTIVRTEQNSYINDDLIRKYPPSKEKEVINYQV
jgi:hypothetical protein